ESNPEKKNTLLKTIGSYSNYLFFAAICAWYFISHVSFGITLAMKRLILVTGFGIPFCFGLFMPVSLAFLSIMAVWFAVFKNRVFLLRINSLPILNLSRSRMTKVFPACFLAALLFFAAGAVFLPGEDDRFVAISAFICGTCVLFVTCFCLWNHILNAEYGITIFRSGISFGVFSMFSWKQVHSYALEEQSDCFHLAIVYGEESLLSRRRKFKVAIPFEFRDDLQNVLSQCFTRQS
ncbi:MAG: hypothetical protein AAFY57_06240, partial [Cyanobacteria bacterium J06642_2]